MISIIFLILIGETVVFEAAIDEFEDLNTFEVKVNAFLENEEVKKYRAIKDYKLLVMIEKDRAEKAEKKVILDALLKTNCLECAITGEVRELMIKLGEGKSIESIKESTGKARSTLYNQINDAKESVRIVHPVPYVNTVDDLIKCLHTIW